MNGMDNYDCNDCIYCKRNGKFDEHYSFKPPLYDCEKGYFKDYDKQAINDMHWTKHECKKYKKVR